MTLEINRHKLHIRRAFSTKDSHIHLASLYSLPQRERQLISGTRMKETSILPCRENAEIIKCFKTRVMDDSSFKRKRA